MDFDEESDLLQLQHLAGGDIVSAPPLYAPNGEFLFLLSDKVIQVYSTNTGELTRQLLGATTKLISMELELKKSDIIIGCTITGELLRWKWSNGKLQNSIKLTMPTKEVLTFNLLNFYANSDAPCAFVTGKFENSSIVWFIANTANDSIVSVPCDLKLNKSNKKPLVAVSCKSFKNVVIAHDYHVYFLNYKSWRHFSYPNAYRVPITVLRMNPVEEMVATGDEVGKIFLWRQFHGARNLVTSLYHWHHTAVTSIAFTASGTSFYSSGLEAVLVKWNVAHPERRDFLPRMCSVIRHIAISKTNAQLAVCTADNAVQIVGSDNKLKTTLQEFTYVMDDKTNKSKFPVGLRLNPRTNTLVLNGRSGHLQFYSAYTKNLLYNMDIVVQNTLSMETGKILYSIGVTKSAFNIDWMATGEVFNDEEHLPELRLKFWKYQEESQSYSLNTNIELPHEGGFKAIEFSNEYQVDQLLCATVGEDNTIKMWSLDESDNIYKKGKVWYCIAQTSYKNMPIESISFSQDGSLLAAGFGNTLCIYKADSLKLKAALTCASGYDGCVQKAQVRVPRQNVNGSKNELAEQRKKIMQLFTNLLESNEETLIKEIQKSLQKSNKKQQEPLKQLDHIDEKQKASLYNKILQMHELNLFQKVLLYQKLGIACQVHPEWQSKMAAYLRDSVSSAGLREKSTKLHKQLNRINIRDRFKAKYRLHKYATRKRNYDAEITQNLVPILSVLNLNANSKQPQLSNGSNIVSKEETNAQVTPPVQTVADINRVQFAAGEYAHLVVVCTETRVLIWNLLTLRLQSVMKLSVKHLAFDAQTNLIAAFTKNNDLHVFQPNVPLPIYQRRNLPSLHGAVWLPRRHSKQRSINVDWQAQSTLYFLTDSQEIMFLGTSADSDAPPPITFNNAAVPDGLRYSTFGTYATQQFTDKQAVQKRIGPLIIGNSGKNAVKSLMEMSTHTMPPLSLLCGDFVKSLVKPVDSSDNAAASKSNDSSRTAGGSVYDADGDAHMNGNASHSESEAEDSPPTNAKSPADATAMRKSLLTKSTEISKIYLKTAKAALHQHTHVNTESLLKRIATQHITLEF